MSITHTYVLYTSKMIGWDGVSKHAIRSTSLCSVWSSSPEKCRDSLGNIGWIHLPVEFDRAEPLSLGNHQWRLLQTISTGNTYPNHSPISVFSRAYCFACKPGVFLRTLVIKARVFRHWFRPAGDIAHAANIPTSVNWCPWFTRDNPYRNAKETGFWPANPWRNRDQPWNQTQVECLKTPSCLVGLRYFFEMKSGCGCWCFETKVLG